MNVKDPKTLVRVDLAGTVLVTLCCLTSILVILARGCWVIRSHRVSRLRITTRARHIHRPDYLCHIAQTQG